MSRLQVIYELESMLGQTQEIHHSIKKRVSDKISKSRLLDIEELIGYVNSIDLEQAIISNLDSDELNLVTGSKYISSLPIINPDIIRGDLPFGLKYNGTAKERIIVGCRPLDIYPTNNKNGTIMITDKHDYIISIGTIEDILNRLTEKKESEIVNPMEKFDSIYLSSNEHPGLEGTHICNTRVVHPKKPVYVQPVREFETSEYNVLVGYSSLANNGKNNTNPLRIMKIDQKIV